MANAASWNWKITGSTRVEIVLKFQGIETISDAETLLRSEVQIPRQDRAPLEEGATYVSDLRGL